MKSRDMESFLKEEIYKLSDLKGIEIANKLLSLYQSLSSEKTVEERLEIISTLWGFVEDALDTSSKDLMHPYLKKQDDPEQSKKGLLGSAWEQIFEMLANEFLETLNVKVIKLSKENLEKFVEEMNLGRIEEMFNIYKKFGLIGQPRFSKARIIESFYADIKNQLKVYIDDEYKVTVNPDCDLIIIKYINDGSYRGKMLVLAVLSSKKKFRERIAQVGYWTVKFRHSGSKIKNLLITPDEDKDFLKEGSDHKKIAEVDTDGTYVVYPDDVGSHRIRHLKFLREDVKNILEERRGEIELYENYGKVISRLLDMHKE